MTNDRPAPCPGDKIRVLYVYDGDWPRGATRVLKQTRALAEVGHDVMLLCRSAGGRPRHSSESWMQVTRLPTFPGDSLNAALSFPLFFSPLWLFAIWSNAIRFDADLIVVEDLPLAPACLLIAGVLRVPVLYDMGEVYPEFLSGLRQYKRLTVVDRIVRSPGPARIVEWLTLRMADHTTVVSEESRARAIRLGTRQSQLTIVGNTPLAVERLSRKVNQPCFLDELAGRRIVLFVGVIISDRGVDTAVRAMAHVRRRCSDAVLLVVGDGTERGYVESLTADLGLDEHVKFLGWRPHEELPAYYQSAQVGLLPFHPGGQIGITLANKLFDYLGAGLAVVASDVPPMRRVLTEAGLPAQVLTTPSDPRSLADSICYVLELPAKARSDMGDRGRTLVMKQYRWEHDAARFVEAARQAVTNHENGGH